MVQIQLKFMSMVRLRAGMGEASFSSQSTRLKDILREVVEKYGIADLIFAPDGRIRPWARVLVNGRSCEFVGGLDAQLKDGDRVGLVFSFPYHEDV